MGEARLSLYDLTVYSQAEGLGPLRQAIIYYCNYKRNESKSSIFPRWSQNGFYSFASKITEGGYCSHEIKRHLLLERKPMIKLVAAQLFSCIQLFVTPWTEALQASLSFTIFLSVLKLMSIELVMPSTISSSAVPFSLRLQSFPASGSFLMSWVFAQDWNFCSPCCPRDSQESSPTSQFKSINSSVLRLLYGATLTSTHV